MTKLEAQRNMVLYNLGWLGLYTYEELPITDQLYIDEKVIEGMGQNDLKAKQFALLIASQEALKDD